MRYARDRLDGLTVDSLSIALAGLFLTFQGCVLYLVHPAVTSSEPVKQSGSASDGGSLLLIAALEIVVLLACWRAFKRLPDRWKQRIVHAVKTVFAPVLYLASLFGSYRWLAFNILGFGMGIVITATLSLTFQPSLVLAGLVILTVYDFMAVNLSAVMGDLVELSSTARLPNFIVIPNTLDCDFEELRRYIAGERPNKPASVGMVIGVGDFLFPSVLVGSVYVQTGLSPAVGGAIVGTVVAALVLRDSLERADGGLPALPWLNTGAIGGFFVGMLLSNTSIIVALGL